LCPFSQQHKKQRDKPKKNSNMKKTQGKKKLNRNDIVCVNGPLRLGIKGYKGDGVNNTKM